MPRKRRIFSPTGIYHIILRSVNQHIIFEEDADYQKFLFILSDSIPHYDIDIYAYCLMDNHIHLLISSSAEQLSHFFQSLGTRFVRWYNNKYFRTGHLFQDRFFSVPVDSERQFLWTLIYIHNNPIKAGVCQSPSDYRWSSYHAFYGERNSIVTLDYSYELLGSKEALIKFFATHWADKEIDNEIASCEEKNRRHLLTDEQALERYKSISNLKTGSEALSLPKTQRNELIRNLIQSGLTQKQIARIIDISIPTVQRICKN